MAISADNQLGVAPGSATPGAIVFNGGTLNGTTTFTLNANRGIAMNGDGTINVNGLTTLTYDGIIASTGNLTKSGAGTLVFGGDNTYSGSTTVSVGTLIVNGLLGNSANVTVNIGATYEPGLSPYVINGSDEVTLTSSLAVLSLSGSGILNLGEYTLTIGRPSSVRSTEFSGVIAGTGGLHLAGGTLKLSGNNLYSGGTLVTSGVLVVTNSLGLGDVNGALRIYNATMDLQASIVIGSLRMNSGASIMNSSMSPSSLSVLGESRVAGTITTFGDQNYLGNVTIGGGSCSTVYFYAPNSNIYFAGKVNATSYRHPANLAVIAEDDNVTFNEDVGGL